MKKVVNKGAKRAWYPPRPKGFSKEERAGIDHILQKVREQKQNATKGDPDVK